MPTPVFADPGTEATFDTGTLYGNAAFTAGAGALTSATDQPDIGIRALKAVVTTTAGVDAANTSTADGILSDAGRRISFRLRLSALPPTHPTVILTCAQAFASTGNGTFVFGLNATGHIVIGNEGGASSFLGTSVAALVTNTWTQRIAMAYVITDATHWTLKLYINGVLDTTLTQANGTLANLGSSVLSIGLGGGPGTAGFDGGTGAMTAWYRDIYVDDGTDLADPASNPTNANTLRLTAKRPNANGTATNFATQIGSGGSGYGSGHSPQVNERASSDANGWSATVVASAITEEYTVENVATGDVDLTGKVIDGVLGWIRASSTLTETDNIIVDGTVTAITVTSTIKTFFKASATPTVYPAGSGTDIGMQTNATAATASLYEAGIIVASTPATVVIDHARGDSRPFPFVPGSAPVRF